DAVDGLVPVAADAGHAPGSVFAPGDTLVTLTSKDAHGNTATHTFTVTVPDLTSPSVSVAFGPGGLVRTVVSNGTLTLTDATGPHVLASGVRSASVAFGPAGQVL